MDATINAPIGSRVIDKVAEQVGDAFEHFLEKYLFLLS
jgi:hypothetical protein